MSSSNVEVQNVKCCCKTNAAGECVCVYKVSGASCAPGKTIVLNLECMNGCDCGDSCKCGDSCNCGDGKTACRGKFELKCNSRANEECGTDTYTNVAKCGGCVCRFEIQKPKCCSVSSSEIDCSNCPKTSGKGGCCK